MNIQFYHKRLYKKYAYDIDGISGNVKTLIAKGGLTIALQVPTVEQFDAFQIYSKDHYGSYPSIELQFGIAKCSNEDNYNRKLGRKITMGRLDTVGFWVRKESENEIILCDLNCKFPELVLLKSPKGGRVYLIGTAK